MDYESVINSMKNLTKTVKWLPEILCKSFCKAIQDFSLVAGEVTLIEFEKWWDNLLKEYFNVIANIKIKQEENPKVFPYTANTDAGTNIRIKKWFVGYAINQTHILIAKNLLRKTCKKEKNLSQPINFAGTV